MCAYVYKRESVPPAAMQIIIQQYLKKFSFINCFTQIQSDVVTGNILLYLA